jgi:hypothetical protein
MVQKRKTKRFYKKGTPKKKNSFFVAPKSQKSTKEFFDNSVRRQRVCNEVTDELTTYVGDRVYNAELGDYVIEPYVECGYVE